MPASEVGSGSEVAIAVSPASPSPKLLAIDSAANPRAPLKLAADTLVSTGGGVPGVILATKASASPSLLV